MKKYVIIGMLVIAGCATAKPVVAPITPTTPHKVTLNIVSTDKAADGCSLAGNDAGDQVELACKPGCTITFNKDGKVDRNCKVNVKP